MFFLLSKIPNADLVSECASKAVVVMLLLLRSRMACARLGKGPSLFVILLRDRLGPNHSLHLASFQTGPISHHNHSVLFLEIHFPIPFRFHKVSIAALPLAPRPFPSVLKERKTPFPKTTPKTVAHHFVPTPILHFDFCQPRTNVCRKDQSRADH
jgi:hypothetical protein